MSKRYKFSEVNGKHGAPMGRCAELPENLDAPCKVRLERMRLVDGDYDNGGAYWGGGMDSMPLWVAHADGVELVVRASDRDEAKELVTDTIPGARFYR